MSWFNKTPNPQATMDNSRNNVKIVPQVSSNLNNSFSNHHHSKIGNNYPNTSNCSYTTNANGHGLSLVNEESSASTSHCKQADSESFSNKFSPPQTPSGGCGCSGDGDQDRCSLYDGGLTNYTSSSVKTPTTTAHNGTNDNENSNIYDNIAISKVLTDDEENRLNKPSPRLLDEEFENLHISNDNNQTLNSNHDNENIDNDKRNENELTTVDKRIMESLFPLTNDMNDRYEIVEGMNDIYSPIPLIFKEYDDAVQSLSSPLLFNNTYDDIKNITFPSSHSNVNGNTSLNEIFFNNNNNNSHSRSNKLSTHSATTSTAAILPTSAASTTAQQYQYQQQSSQQMTSANHTSVQQKQPSSYVNNNSNVVYKTAPNVQSNVANSNYDERIYQLLIMYAKFNNNNISKNANNSLSVTELCTLYQKQYKEVLLKGPLLLKYLVQLPNVLLISRKDKKDIMLFVTSVPVYQIVINILKNVNYDGMTIEEFTCHLYYHLSNNPLIYECDVIDFLKRWRIVQVFDNDKYVRLNITSALNVSNNVNNPNAVLTPFTVFLGNLKINQWNENKIYSILLKINPQWTNLNLKIRLNKTNQNIMNAFIDFPSFAEAQNAISLIKKFAYLFENQNDNTAANNTNNITNNIYQVYNPMISNNYHSSSFIEYNDGTTNSICKPYNQNVEELNKLPDNSQYSMYASVSHSAVHKNKPYSANPYYYASGTCSQSSLPRIANSMYYSPSIVSSSQLQSQTQPQPLLQSQTQSQLQSQLSSHYAYQNHVFNAYKFASHNNINNNVVNNNQKRLQHSYNHTNHNNNNINSNTNNNENYREFQEITNNIYQLIRAAGGKMLMSQIESEYEKCFKKPLNFSGNPKCFVKMEKLLLLNCDKTRDDVMVFYTPEPAYKLVVSILKQNTNFNNVNNASNNNISINADNSNNNTNGDISSDITAINDDNSTDNNKSDDNHTNNDNNNNNNSNLSNQGILVSQFRSDLEQRMGMSLDGCDFNDFLMRWRFLSIRKNNNDETVVLFTPHTGTTVFFGNLNVECTENDIYDDLEKIDMSWKHCSVRLKLGKGFAYAFVDFPSRDDALRAVKYFDGRAVFKSKYVSADIEAIEQKRLKMNSDNISHNNDNNRYHNLQAHTSGHTEQNVINSHAISFNPQIGSNYNVNNINMINGQLQYQHNQRINSSLSSSVTNKTTIYLGNLKDNITKQQIQDELFKVNPTWKTLTIRLNLRSGWSHAFIDFEHIADAKKLIHLWHNKANPLLSNTRLRCEISKRQII